MQTEIKKWGNSAVVRLPAAMLAEINLCIGSQIDLRAEGNKLVIEPASKHEYKLDDLLAGITQDNLHAPVDWGVSVGNELVI